MKLVQNNISRYLRKTLRRSLIIKSNEVDQEKKLKYEEIYCQQIDKVYQKNLSIWENSEENTKVKIDIILKTIDKMSQNERDYLTYLISKNSLQTAINGGIEEIVKKIQTKDTNPDKEVFMNEINSLESEEQSMTISKFLNSSNKKSGNNKSNNEVAVKEEEVVEEVVQKTKFTVKLTEVPAAKKLVAIKEIKSILGLGLKDAKTLVESAPVELKTDLTSEESEELKEKIEGLGCSAEII